MFARKFLAGLVAVLALVGCTPLGLLNAVSIAEPYELKTDVAYGEGDRRKLDIYQPPNAQGAPVVVFFYGGRWQSGDKDEYRFVGEALASRGFVAVIPDYRLYPDVIFPAFVEDAAAAVAWVHQNVGRFGGDAATLHLMGHSAGAHIAGLLATDERYLLTAGAPPKVLDSFVGLAGPYDFLPFTDADIRALMGPEAQWPTTQPVNFVDGAEPPMLLLHGADDTIARPTNSTSLASRLEAAGGRAEAKIYPRVEHYRILVALARPFRGIAPVLDDATSFMRANTNKP